MPNYDYHCPANGETVEVMHGINEKLTTWGALCEKLGRDVGATDPNAPVHKQISVPRMAFPKGNAELRSQGFSKLVRREKGVYENVTANEGEKRFMKAGESGNPTFTDNITD